MQCLQCAKTVGIITSHEQFLFGASGLCADCRDKAFEESYRDQTELRCRRQFRQHDWAEEVIVCEVTHKPVSSTSVCDGFEVA